jgi:exodeoxyribonuclease V beta subunit
VLESEDLIDDAIDKVKVLLDLGVNVNDIAFLVSTNKDGQSLQEACERQGIETLLKTSSSLKNVPKIAALVAMVSYLFYGEKIDEEALLLKAGRSLDEIDISWFSAFMSPLQVVDRLVREFGYFDNDLNILKLLEFASAFSDIPTFLEEFRTSSVSLASNSVHGAKIMTIHGSKGLEFEYVILLDKLTRPNADKSALIFHYNDDLYIDQILYRSKGREYFDENYASIMEERKSSARKDRLNVLYVALTRAVEGMIIIKKPKDSIFDEINISPLEMGEISVQRSEFSVQKERGQALPVVITNYGTQDVANKEEDTEKDLEAILFGTALHYTLEMLGSFSREDLPAAMNALQNKYGQVLRSEQTEEIEKRVRRLIENESFQKFLAEAKISKEQALSFDGELKQIDLLLEYEDRCMVIDYKSSKKYQIKHQKQVGFYKKAIEKITDKDTEGLIVYLLEGDIELQHI